VKSLKSLIELFSITVLFSGICTDLLYRYHFPVLRYTIVDYLSCYRLTPDTCMLSPDTCYIIT